MGLFQIYKLIKFTAMNLSLLFITLEPLQPARVMNVLYIVQVFDLSLLRVGGSLPGKESRPVSGVEHPFRGQVSVEIYNSLVVRGSYICFVTGPEDAS